MFASFGGRFLARVAVLGSWDCMGGIACSLLGVCGWLGFVGGVVGRREGGEWVVWGDGFDGG